MHSLPKRKERKTLEENSKPPQMERSKRKLIVKPSEPNTQGILNTEVLKLESSDKLKKF